MYDIKKQIKKVNKNIKLMFIYALFILYNKNEIIKHLYVHKGYFYSIYFNKNKIYLSLIA